MKQREYFRYVDFSDALLNKVEQKNSDGFVNPVFEFVLNYLVTGFERLNMEGVSPVFNAE